MKRRQGSDLASEHVHMIGIGGTGMTALAGLLHETGCRVTGSDKALYPPTSTLLERMGLEAHVGFDAAHLSPAPDLVVVGNAVSRGNPEVEEVLDRRLPYASMPQVIEERFLNGNHAIVVAGTHGKTTTTSMLAWVLHHAGREPGFLIGGAPLNFELPYRPGSGNAFVIEGDEYDTAFFDKGPKFMHYRPDTVLLGTVEFDHADIYRDEQAVSTAFRRLVNLVPRRGLIVRHEESELARKVTDDAFSRVEGYGLEAGGWRATALRETEAGTLMSVQRDGRRFAEIQLQVLGRHNVRNALSVIAAAHDQGLSAAEIEAGLGSYRGVRRRLELLGEPAGVRVFDDFAHHPTAIDETLRAVRARYTGRRVWAVLEPRSWSLRRGVFQERLAGVFDAADRILVAPVFNAAAIAADERLDVERLTADLAARGKTASAMADADEILAHLLASVGTGDVVVIMSNGGFDGLHRRLLGGLAERAQREGHASCAGGS